MPLIQEGFDGGLVTVRDATLLKPGELQQADDCIYRPYDPAIWRAPGRTVYNSSALGSPSAIKGLAWLSADRTNDHLLAYVDTDLYVSTFSTITGTWTKLLNVGTLSDSADSELMTLAKYAGSYFVYNGVDRPRKIQYVTPPLVVVDTCSGTLGDATLTCASTSVNFANVMVGQYVSGTGIASGARVLSKTSNTEIELDTVHTGTVSGTATFAVTPFIDGRIAGMDPVPQLETTPTAATGTWISDGDYGGDGYYWFFYTEMYMPSGKVDDYEAGFLESAFTGFTSLKSQYVSITTTQQVTVTRNTNLTNNGAAGRPTATHWQVYMSPRSDSTEEMPDLSRFIRIGAPTEVGTTSRVFNTTVDNTGWKVPTSNTTKTGWTALTDPTNAYAVGGSWAYAPNSGYGSAFGDFGITDASKTVTGIEVELSLIKRPAGSVEGYGYYVQLYNGSKYSQAWVGERRNWSEVITLGGQNALWAPSSSWANSDFTNANSFKVFVGSHWYGFYLDYVRVRVWYTTSFLDANGVTYRTISYRSQVGTTVTDSAALPPPISSVGDIFQGQVVVNDVSDPATVRFSLPGYPEYFPKPYFLRFDTLKKDVVKAVKRVGQVLVVGLQDSCRRVNYLPREVDTDFEQGLAHEPIDSSVGVVGPNAYCLVNISGGGEVMAFVSHTGLFITDGITCRPLNIDLDWDSTVAAAYLGNAILRNYPRLKLLAFYYTPYGGTTNTKVLYFSYDPMKIKEGGFLPAVGPCSVSARAACEATISGVSYLLTAHYTDGKVYVEDSGLTDASGGTIVPIVKTRQIYPAGLDGEARVQKLYLRASAYGASSSISCTTTSASTTVTSSAAFGSVVAGMYVYGTGILPGTVVTAKSDSSTITISQAATASGSASLTFTDGTISVNIRGQDIREAMTSLETTYQSTDVGGLILVAPDNQAHSFELKIAKVILPSAASADLSKNLRMHYFAYQLFRGGPENNLSGS